MGEMSEKRWTSCSEIADLLEHLCPIPNDDPRLRKVMLFTVACLRRIWSAIEGEIFHQAIESLEAVAEGRNEFRILWDVNDGLRRVRKRTPAQDAVVKGTEPNPSYAAVQASQRAASHVANKTDHAARKAEKRAQGDLFRDIFGNPFRRVAFGPNWKTHTVLALARGIYDEPTMPLGIFDNQRLAVLADAMEEVGCTDPEILGHLRSAGAHVRGCWVLDAILRD
jgi:hypothetical protein